jgi:hypothetical protein
MLTPTEVYQQSQQNHKAISSPFSVTSRPIQHPQDLSAVSQSYQLDTLARRHVFPYTINATSNARRFKFQLRWPLAGFDRTD